MPFSTSPTPSSPDDRDRLIPFPSRGPSEFDARSINAANAARRRREQADRDRAGAPRRPRRRRHSAPWLQRNALSIAALSVLVALLGLGFGLVQALTRAEPAPALLALSPAEQQPTAVVAATTLSLAPALVGPAAPSAASPSVRTIQATAKVIEPNYTIKNGDTLGSIAREFNTTIERIQAFNTGLTDPRALRIGTKLVIPPPL